MSLLSCFRPPPTPGPRRRSSQSSATLVPPQPLNPRRSWFGSRRQPLSGLTGAEKDGGLDGKMLDKERGARDQKEVDKQERESWLKSLRTKPKPKVQISPLRLSFDHVKDPDPFRASLSPAGFHSAPLSKTRSSQSSNGRRTPRSSPSPSSGATPPPHLARLSSPSTPIDVFGEVKVASLPLSPSNIPIARKASGSKRQSVASSVTDLLPPTPPPSGPLPTIPTPPAAAITSTNTSARTPSSRRRECVIHSSALTSSPKHGTPTNATKHRRNSSNVSRSSSIRSAQGTYFNEYNPVPSPLLTAPPSAAPLETPLVPILTTTTTTTTTTDSTETPKTTTSGTKPVVNFVFPQPKPKPLSQDVPRRSGRRAPARPETAEDPCLILKEADYIKQNVALIRASRALDKAEKEEAAAAAIQKREDKKGMKELFLAAKDADD